MAIAQNFPTISPSLNLSFALTKALDPRITFARASTATYYGTRTALAEQNLLLQSQTFDTASWTKFRSTVTANATAAPDGTTTAEKLIPNNGLTNGGMYNSGVSLVSSTQYTGSIFVKASELGFVFFNINVRGSTSTTGVCVNLSDGTQSNVGADATFTVTNVGSGWYRISGVATATTSLGYVEAYPLAAAGSNNSYTGNGTSGIFVWGAQLEQRSSVTAYTVTTTQPITNYIPVLETAAAGVARFDHNPISGDSLGFLVEQQSTNLATQSQTFTTWAKSATTVTNNVAVAPDGTLTSSSLVPTATSTGHSMYLAASLGSGTFTFSVYAKQGGYPRLGMRVYDGTAYQIRVTFDISTGTIVSNTAGTATITPVGNGWYRCTCTGTSASGNMGTVAGWTIESLPAANTVQDVFLGDGYSGAYVWGAQLEAASFATSYIATVASQVTRAVDAASMTGTNFSSWYNQAEGSFYVEGLTYANSSNRGFWAATAATANDTNLISCLSGTARHLFVNLNGVNVVDLSPGDTTTPKVFLPNVYGKAVAAYKTNDFAAATTGSAVLTDTSGVLPTPNTLLIGAYTTSLVMSGTIKKIAYYPIRLSNTNLVALTG